MKTSTTNNTTTSTSDKIQTVLFFAIPSIIITAIVVCINVYGISDISLGS